MAKPSTYPRSPRNIINVFAFLSTLPSSFLSQKQLLSLPRDAQSFFVSEGTYQMQRGALLDVERQILHMLGCTGALQVALPFALCLNYLHTLALSSHARARELARRAWAHLNSALLSPQLLYLTHQPPCLAVAAIYLAAKETEVKLPDVNWWEVFDTDREALGFLVASMWSFEGFPSKEKATWNGKKVPLTAKGVAEEVESLGEQCGEPES